MKLEDLIDQLNFISETRGDVEVLMYDTETGTCVEIENVEFCRPEQEHGRTLEVEDPCVVILPWTWDSEED